MTALAPKRQNRNRSAFTRGPNAMTVEQLMEALQDLPRTAVVLYEDDCGYALIGDFKLITNENGMPDEVILLPDTRD